MPSRPRDVTVLFLDGSHASTAVGPLEVFRSAGVLWNVMTGAEPAPPFRVRAASVGGRPVRPDGPYALTPDHAIERIARTDLVFVPSAGLGLDALLAANAPVIRFLRRMHDRGARIAGVCSGVALVAAAGLLDGRVATTHWGLAEAFRARFPKVEWQPHEIVTESGGVFCGGGVHSALDLALHLVERLCGRGVALECSKALVIDMPRPCQAGFAVLPVGTAHADPTIRRAEEWIHRHCREPFRFEALARELGLSPRHFFRRFRASTGHTPTAYLQRLRIDAAKRMLEEDHVSVQEVSARVGYDDAAFFRDLFRRHTGLAPLGYRKRFGGERRP